VQARTHLLDALQNITSERDGMKKKSVGADWEVFFRGVAPSSLRRERGKSRWILEDKVSFLSG